MVKYELVNIYKDGFISRIHDLRDDGYRRIYCGEGVIVYVKEDNE